MLETGISRHRGVGNALLWRIHTVRLNGDLQQAAALIKAAGVVIPGTPALYRARAQVSRADAPWALHHWGRLEVSRMVAHLSDSAGRLGVFRAFFLFSGGCLGLFFICFMLGQLLRYGLSICFGFATSIPGAYRLVALGIWGSFFHVMANHVTGGVFAIAFLLVGLLTVYQSRFERRLLLMGLAYIACLPSLLGGVLESLDEMRLDARQLTGLQENPYLISKTPWTTPERVEKSDLQLLVLALAQKRKGLIDKPLETVSGEMLNGIAHRPLKGAGWNLRGNLLLADGQYELAKKAYLKARGCLPGSAAPSFNLSRLANLQSKAASARKHLADATDIDAQQVAQWSGRDGMGINRYIVDINPGFRALTWANLARVTGAFVDSEALREPVHSHIVILAFFSFFGCLIITRIHNRLNLVVPCSRCGCSTHIAAAEGEHRSAVCDDCTRVFLRTSPVDRRIKIKKEQHVARFEAASRLGRLLVALFLPGVADAAGGKINRLLVQSVLLTAGLWSLAGALLPEYLESSWVAPYESVSASVGFTLIGVSVLMSFQSALRIYRGYA